MVLITKSGDLLDATEDAIVHQCNCVTNYPKGLSKAIFTKWPFSDVYSCRQNDHKDYKDTPGTIKIRRKESTIIVNLFGQYYPSKPKYINDTAKKRLKWFEQGLLQIATKLPNIKSIAFPFKIGCGLAKGNWQDYFQKLKDFATNNPHINVVIYKLE